MSSNPNDLPLQDDGDRPPGADTTDSFFTKQSATVERPSLPPQDLIAFLSVAQSCDVDFLPIVWHPGLGSVGEGGSATVDQSVVDRSRSFAFKRFHWTTDSDTRLLPLISEVLILSQNAIANHPNIVDLLGICWDVEPGSERLQPVLVFEKAAWNLQQFLRTEEGMQLSFHERLQVCAELADAIATMHAYHVIHGDIKPHNVLVYRDFSGQTSTKMADFGYSTLLATEAQTVRMPRSVPWNAPEHTFAGVGEVAAKKMDIYSFALMCLWVMFKESQVGEEVQALGVDCPVGSTVGDIFSHQGFKQLKDCDQLAEIACTLLDNLDVSAEQVTRLKAFFNQSLCKDTERRTSNFMQAVGLLNPEIKSLQSSETLETANRLGVAALNGKFRVASAVHWLVGDHRVRKGVIKSLQKSYTTALAAQQASAKNIAFQVAFCYHIGFGIPGDEKQCAIWLGRCQNTLEDLEKEMQTVNRDIVGFRPRNPKIDELEREGILVRDRMQTYERGHQTSGPRDWDLVLPELQQEAECIKRHFGELHGVTLELNWIICNIWDEQGKFQEAQHLREHILREIRNPEVPESAEMPEFQACNEVIHSHIKLGNLGRARVLQKEMLEALDKEFGQDHLRTVRATVSLAHIYHGQGLWKESEPLCLRAVEVNKTTFGPDHPTTLAAMSNLAGNYRRLGKLEAAEELDHKTFIAYRNLLGPEHPSTINSMNSLAATYQKKGKLEEAHRLLLSIKDVSSRVLGAKHPGTLYHMQNLGGIAASLFLWKESEDMLKHVVEARTELFGINHPETLRTYHIIASVLTVRGMLSEAEKVYKRVADNRKRVLGPTHPDTLTSMYELATVYLDNGNPKASEELHKEVGDLRLKTLGKEHPDTLLSMHGLSTVYRVRGQYEEAHNITREAVPLMERVLGPNHPTTLQELQNLAQIYDCKGQINDAAHTEARVVEACKTVFGPNHPRTLASIGNLAVSYCSQGKLEIAEQMARDVVAKIKVAIRPEHPDTLGSQQQLADIIAKRRKFAEAEAIVLEVISARERVLGNRHPNTLRSKHRLGSIYRKRGDLSKAEHLLSEVVEMRSEVLGEEHPETLGSMEELGSALWAMGKLQRSEECHVKVLEARTRVLSPEHPETLNSMHNLASTRMALGDLERCVPMNLEAVKLRKRILGDDHERTLMSMNNLAAAYRQLGRLEDAKALLCETVSSLTKVLGPEDPRTLSATDTLACTYSDLRELDRAEELFAKVVSQRRLILGSEHAQTLLSVHNHATTLWRLSRWSEAVELEAQAVEISQKIHGQDHPYTRAFVAGLKQMRDGMKNLASSSN